MIITKLINVISFYSTTDRPGLRPCRPYTRTMWTNCLSTDRKAIWSSLDRKANRPALLHRVSGRKKIQTD